MKKFIIFVFSVLFFSWTLTLQPAWAEDPTGSSGGTTTVGGTTSASACDGIEDDFDRAICQLRETFGGLRGLVYIIAGFSLLGIAFAAIYGKISWSWVGMVALCLFVLASAEMIVNYIIDDEDANIDDISTDYEGLDKSLEDSMSELGVEGIDDGI